jgi:hypothetical protein
MTVLRHQPLQICPPIGKHKRYPNLMLKGFTFDNAERPKTAI